MSQQLQITGGAKVRSLEGVITGTSGVLNSLPINGSSGIPQLDSNGKILVSQLPNSVMEYKGTWNATTNTPTLVNGTGNQGDVYLCNVAGTANFGAGPITFAVGDQVIYSGTIWQKASGATGTVTSVAVTETGDALTITGSPITTSGTINIGFAGTSAQYVAGDGTLITFPTVGQASTLISEVYNETGATLTKGTVVYINGGHGNLPTITKALATSDATSAQTYGVVRADITNNNNGYVIIIGSLTDLDTQAYANGTQLYLSSTTAGAWTSTKQYAPAHLVYVGIVTRSHPTQGVVEIKIQNGYELDELHNVSAQTPSNNDGIFYNSSTSLWENKSIATVLGYVPVGGTGTANQVAFFDTTNTITSESNLYWDSTNNRLGINIATPTNALDVSGNTRVAGTIYANAQAGSPALYINGIDGFFAGRIYGAATTNYSLGLQIQAGTSAIDSPFSLVSYNGTTEFLRMLGNGNLGINISNPSYLLDVNGVANIRGQLRLQSTITNGTYTYTLPNATGTLLLNTAISGTTNYIPKFTSANVIGNSSITDDGSYINAYTNSFKIYQPSGVGPAFEMAATSTEAQMSSYSSSYGYGKINFFGAGLDFWSGAVGSIGLNLALSISTTGNVGIGTTSPSQPLHVYATSTTTSSYFETSSANSYIGLKSTSGVCYIGNVGYALTFEAGGSEKMRITAGGSLGLGTSNPFGVNSGMLSLVGSGSVYNFLNIQDTVNQSNTTFIQFLNSTGGGVGQIVRVGTTNAVNYNTTSDYRLKEDLKEINGLGKILAIKVYDFKWKDNDARMDGVLAHELQEIIPFAVTGEKDAMNKDGNIKTQSVDYSKIVPSLIKSIQELKAEIDELKNK